jgi:hypothetical protein
MSFKLGYNAAAAIVDPSSQALVQVDGPHYEIHRGAGFVGYVHDIDLDSAAISIAFKTPNSAGLLHILPQASADKASTFEIFEAPTITAGTGTDRAAVNRRRTSTSVSGVSSMAVTPVVGSYTYNSTITNTGTTLYTEVIGGGRGNFGSTSSSRGTAEWILKPNTIYAFRLTASVNDTAAAIELDWYGHPDAIEITNG